MEQDHNRTQEYNSNILKLLVIWWFLYETGSKTNVKFSCKCKLPGWTRSWVMVKQLLWSDWGKQGTGEASFRPILAHPTAYCLGQFHFSFCLLSCGPNQCAVRAQGGRGPPSPLFLCSCESFCSTTMRRKAPFQSHTVAGRAGRPKPHNLLRGEQPRCHLPPAPAELHPGLCSLPQNDRTVTVLAFHPTSFEAS